MPERPLLLEGIVQPPQDVSDLRAETAALKKKLLDAKHEAEAERENSRAAKAALVALRRQLEPLHRALRAVFGEIDSAGISGVGDAAAAAPSSDVGQPIPAERYAAWKTRLSPACGKIIDALLVQSMTKQALKSYCKLGSTSIAEGVKTLAANGLAEEHGGRWRLKA